MPAETATKSIPVTRRDPYLAGIVAGTIGAATIALWFLILDSIKGRPLFTPNVLGSVLFRPGGGLVSPEGVPISGPSPGRRF